MKKRASTDIKARLGAVIRHRRTALSMTQEQFAEKCGLHRTYIADIERGARNVSLENIERISKGLGVSIWEILKEAESS